jgi:hypothetical protein
MSLGKALSNTLKSTVNKTVHGMYHFQYMLKAGSKPITKSVIGMTFSAFANT